MGLLTRMCLCSLSPPSFQMTDWIFSVAGWVSLLILFVYTWKHPPKWLKTSFRNIWGEYCLVALDVSFLLSCIPFYFRLGLTSYAVSVLAFVGFVSALTDFGQRFVDRRMLWLGVGVSTPIPILGFLFSPLSEGEYVLFFILLMVLSLIHI